ncbi:MAG: acyl-CoA synthetase [Alphaproteobacteria bacterium]|nr:acyl-CoA synthetase [Alphaproteobacteria bacterium]
MSDPIGARFAPLFAPRTVAVIGASATGITPGNEFIRHSLALGFAGKIVPIHPTAASIEGLPCARGFAELPEPVDYAYVAVGATQVPAVIAGAKGKLRFAQVISSGFGEIAAGQALDAKLRAAVAESGVRLLGPNCLGTYSPRGRISFVGGSPPAEGAIGIVSQSGGLAVDIILRGAQRGLGFSGVVTIGNSLDLGPADLLAFYLDDPATRAIGLYLEDVKDGRRFFEAMRAARGVKPVVLLLGGQTEQGRKAAASHTGSLASDARIWSGLARQTGAAMTSTLDRFLDTLLAFQTLAPRPGAGTRRVVLFGNGGGTSVLAADAFARAGLSVAAMAPDAIAALEALQLPPGTSVVNPIDAPAGALRQDEGRVAERVLDAVLRLERPDAVVMHINLPVFAASADQRADFVENLVQAALRARSRHPGAAHLVLVLRSDGSAEVDARKRGYRARAVALGIPVFDEMSQAAIALAAVAGFERSAGSTG